MAGTRTQEPGHMIEAEDGRSADDELVSSVNVPCRQNVPLTGADADLYAVHDAYKESYSDLCNYAASFLHSREPAQDCVHQAFTGTFATVKSGSRIEDLKPFLISSVRNNCLNYLRKSKWESVYSFEPNSVLGGEIDNGSDNSAAKSAERIGRWKKVRSAVDDLPPSQRVALLMAEFEGFKYDEIADRMHRSNNSVRQLICRAREKVRSATDGGSDWATIPAPSIEIERMLEQGHMDLSPNMFDRIQVKTSQLQTWLGNMLQSGTESVLHPAASVATGAAVVALAIASPAPPVDQVVGDPGPVAGGSQGSPNLVLLPGDSGGSQSESAATTSVVDLQVRGDGKDKLEGPLRGLWNPRTSEGGHPIPMTPADGRCEGKKSGDRGLCGNGKPDNSGDGKGAPGDDLEDPDGDSSGEESTGLKKTTLTVSMCSTQKTLSKVSSCSISIGNKVLKVNSKTTFTTSQSPVYKTTIGPKYEVLSSTQTTATTVVGEVSVDSPPIVEGESSLTIEGEVVDIDNSGSESEIETSGTVSETDITSEIKSTAVKTTALPGK